jgi:predicted MFS family arabinose efflux permease
MTGEVYQSRAKLATRLAFVAAGFGVACWAPLVPFAKTRCHLGDDTMGLVLLLLGAGSIVAMPLAANLSARFSSKPIVLSGGVGLAVILPLLSIVSSPIALGVALFAFGAFLGSLAFSFSKRSLVSRLGANADLKLERRAAHGGSRSLRNSAQKI